MLHFVTLYAIWLCANKPPVMPLILPLTTYIDYTVKTEINMYGTPKVCVCTL